MECNEGTTTSNYTANKTQYALYPIALRFVDPETGQARKAAIIFISDDLRHDYQQVQKMERE